MRKIGVILGSVRNGRLGESVANWVMEEASTRGGFEYELVDLASFNVPLLTSATVPAAANKQYDDENTAAWSKAIDACDAFVFVTPEYNHSIPGGFKNAFDALGSEWAGKPVAFVGYGADGGVRAVEAWCLIVSNFSMNDLRNQVSLGLFDDFTNGEFTPREIKAGDRSRILGDIEAALA
ncbi:NADPH-dependent FMN reductase [Corynebacterium lipophiloflavum]|uniref:Flavin reductase n=1 Tax=Corynebacterium lipophiloflavum (strain ATCC 700352 / DSM 44291 / CCUG 37336 / JCM 10383 / DMMZ 1944) TaxID=525263 RepID=C0XQ14_CORLD|nr:NAD(P)H-dependent oxidoreductase [Corynebacterium lipophiloflavum]EEI17658.1 flavin reductase [Corynebacterium lipophiloflavum DSM 44291]